MTRRSSTTYRREAPPLARRLLTMDPPISPHPTTVTSPNIAHSVPLFVLLGAPFGPPAVEPQKEASRPRGRSRLVRVTRRGPSAPPALFLLLGAGLRPRLRCSCYSARAFGPACAVRVTRRGPSAPPACGSIRTRDARGRHGRPRALPCPSVSRRRGPRW